MPLRKWMTEHGHPGWYSWLVVISAPFFFSLLAITVSVTLNNRALQRERAQEQAAAELRTRQAEIARSASCLVILTMVEVYGNPVPVTETGRKAATAWKDLGRIFECQGS